MFFFFPSPFELFRSVETAHFSSCPKHLHLPLRCGIKHSVPESRAPSATVHFPVEENVTIRAPRR